jgi:hypothetical protein
LGITVNHGVIVVESASQQPNGLHLRLNISKIAMSYKRVFAIRLARVRVF